MKQYGLQLFSIRDYFTTEENTRQSFLKMAEMGYKTAQTAGTYDYISPELFRRYADEAGIKLVATHYDYNRMLNDIEGTVKYHKTIGAEYIGVGGIDHSRTTTVEGIKGVIDEFNALAKEYAKYGFKLTYHNHAAEFVKVEGKTVFDYYIEGFDPENISFCLDVYWAQFGGADVRGLIEDLAGRVDIIHLKDMKANVIYDLGDGKTFKGPRYTEVGTGNMDFKRIIAAGEKSGCKHFIVEDEFYSTGNSMDSIKMSAEYINANLLEK